MTDSDDKKFRTSPRTRAEVRVRLSEGVDESAPELWATTRDVGRGGAFLRTDKAFDAGTRLTLHVEIGGEQVVVEAEVKWCSPPGAEDAGMGVCYVDPSPELRQQLMGLADQGELPIFELYDD
jgi:Tfp pilus assembly protein PilZ